MPNEVFVEHIMANATSFISILIFCKFDHTGSLPIPNYTTKNPINTTDVRHNTNIPDEGLCRFQIVVTLLQLTQYQIALLSLS